MALPGSGVVNQGLQRTGINTWMVGGSSTVGSSQTVTRYAMTLATTSSAGSYAATDTASNSNGTGNRATVTSFYSQLFDAFPTRAGQAISAVTTIATGNSNFTIGSIEVHDDTAANTTVSSANLFAGIAGQSITKTASFSLSITVQCTYTDNS